MSPLVLVSLFSFHAGTLNSEEGKLESADFYDSRAINQREQVKACSLIIDVKRTRNRKAEGLPDYVINNSYEFFIDNRRILEFRKISSGDKTGDVTICQDCVVLGKTLEYHDSHEKGHNASATYTNGTASDPRMIGFSVDGRFIARPVALRNCVGAPNSTLLGIRREKLADLEAIRIDRRLVTGEQVSYWIAPNQGYSVVRLDTSVVAKRGGEESTNQFSTLTPVSYHEKSGLWFPKSYKVVASTNGIPYDWTSGTITIRSINEALPAKQFEISSYRLPIGTRVGSITPNRAEQVWNGSELESREQIDSDPFMPGFSPPKQVRWWWALAFGVFAIILGLIFVRYRKTRMKSS